jgi:hypothetical protein
VAVVVAFALSSTPKPAAPTSSPTTNPAALPPITTEPAPPAATGTVEATCAQVISGLPLQLGPLSPRTIQTERAVAWGDPAIILRCGVARPTDLAPGSTTPAVLVGNVYWFRTSRGDSDVFTSIDRAVYVEVSVPRKQSYMPLPTLGAAIAAKLPPVCAVPEEGQPQPADDKLCTHRR